MPYFKDEQEVYAYLGRLFLDLIEDEELLPRFLKANTIIQYAYSNPESRITVKMKAGEAPRVDLGETSLEPELVVMTDADMAHRFWLGKVNATVSLARGEWRARGPAAKVLRLIPIVKPAFPRYRAILAQAGRQDLLEAA